jgi:hypothetical protein
MPSPARLRLALVFVYNKWNRHLSYAVKHDEHPKNGPLISNERGREQRPLGITISLTLIVVPPRP